MTQVTQAAASAQTPHDIPTFDFAEADSIALFKYLEHICEFWIDEEHDGLGWQAHPHLQCDGVEVEIAHPDAHENDVIWTVIHEAIHANDFEDDEFKSVVASVLDRHIAKIEAAQSVGNGWNDHFGAGPYQGVLDNGAALRAVMTPEQLAAIKNGGAS